MSALEWLLARLWWVIGGTVVLVAAAVAVFLTLSRWTERREARFAEWRAELAGHAACGTSPAAA